MVDKSYFAVFPKMGKRCAVRLFTITFCHGGCLNTCLKKIIYPQPYLFILVDKVVDKVDNYLLSNDSPMDTTSPAPIVINKSPFVHFSNKKFWISSKLGK